MTPRQKLVNLAADELRLNGSGFSTESANACLENVIATKFKGGRDYYMGLSYLGLTRLCNDVLLAARRMSSQSAPDRARLSQGRACACGCGRQVTGSAHYAGVGCRKRASRKERG